MLYALLRKAPGDYPLKNVVAQMIDFYICVNYTQYVACPTILWSLSIFSLILLMETELSVISLYVQYLLSDLPSPIVESKYSSLANHKSSFSQW